MIKVGGYDVTVRNYADQILVRFEKDESQVIFYLKGKQGSHKVSFHMHPLDIKVVDSGVLPISVVFNSGVFAGMQVNAGRELELSEEETNEFLGDEQKFAGFSFKFDRDYIFTLSYENKVVASTDFFGEVEVEYNAVEVNTTDFCEFNLHDLKEGTRFYVDNGSYYGQVFKYEGKLGIAMAESEYELDRISKIDETVPNFKLMSEGFPYDESWFTGMIIKEELRWLGNQIEPKDIKEEDLPF